MSKVFAYDKEKYLANLNKVNYACNTVIDNCDLISTQAEKDEFDNLIGDLFLNEKLLQLFILTNEDEKSGKNIPCAFAVFTKFDAQTENSWVLNSVFGIKDKNKVDYAKKILKYSLKNLKEKGTSTVVCEISKKDEKHKKLFDNLSETFVSGFYSETESEVSYVFDLTKDFKEDKTLSALGKSVVISTNVKENLISEKIRGWQGASLVLFCW